MTNSGDASFPSTPPAPRPSALHLAFFPVLYFVGAKIGVAFTIMPEGMAILWPPNSVLLAALVLFRGAGWPLLFALALAAEVAADLPVFTLLEAMFFGMVNILEASIAYLLLRRWQFEPRFESIGDVLKFVLAAPVIGAFVAGTLGASIYSYFRGGEASYLEFLRIWWFGDALGLMILTPLFFGFAYRTRVRVPVEPAGTKDLIAALAATLTVALIVASQFGALGDFRMDPVLLLPFVLYVAARAELRWTALAMTGVTLLIVVLMTRGLRPFGDLPDRDAVIIAQSVIFTMTLTTLGLCALLFELRSRQADLEQVNRALEERTRALARSNEQLEEFARMASHDMQTPLRGISGFLQLLRTRYEGRLDDKADDWIRRAGSSADQMQNLLRTMLASSTERGLRGDRHAVALDEALDEALDGLSEMIRETNAGITRGSLPNVLGERPQLVRLFQNLVGNSMKYRGAERARIHVDAEVRDGMVFVSVSDNGIGIAPEHREVIFEKFQRVQRDSPIHGDGIGLAICKQIVDACGGRIWVESEPGAGSTFHFTVPFAGEDQ